jgi:GWxTD domain-containing protein
LGFSRESLTSAAIIEADVVLNRSVCFRGIGLLFVAILAIGLLCLSPKAMAATQHHGLPDKYEHWLDAEVNYLITDEEKKIFLHLPTDKDRDKFIETFWAVRNPDPNSPTNSFREEHYRRLDYANNNFGPRGANDGWRTDRGMVYITLGPPQQRRPYPNTQDLNPMEIWFYQDPGRALAPYFSVIFFQRSAAEEYKLYSPYIDGPEKLIASTNAVNNPPAALKIIKQDLGNEVANLTLSLFPNEPVDNKNGTRTLESDTLLNKIRDYRNLPVNVDLLLNRRALLEGVTHRVLLGQDYSELTVMATRDSANEASIHYLLRVLNPTDFVLGKDTDQRVYYSLAVEATLLDHDGKEIYTDTQDLHDFLSDSEVSALRTRSLGITGRLPAIPGTYQLRVDVTNRVTKQSFAQTHAVLVPAFDHSLGISQVVFAAQAAPQRDYSQTQPFSFSGVKLPVAGSDNLELTSGSPMRVIYQLWEQPGSPAWLQGKTLQVSYLIGQLGVANKSEQAQTIDRARFDPQGNLLNGLDIPTRDLHPGNYRLVIHVTDPENNETTSQAINFRLIANDAHPLWTLATPSYTNSADSSLNLYRRGLCALALQQPQLAVNYLKQAIETGTPDATMYNALASAYRKVGNETAAVATEKLAKQGAGPASN